jgi:hypothetical protein
LLGPAKWTYFYLYVILDVFSRYVVGCVWRQLLFPVSDNYFSRSATITTFTNPPCRSTLSLTGAEDKALQGCNLSADSGARPGREAAGAADPPVLILV